MHLKKFATFFIIPFVVAACSDDHDSSALDLNISESPVDLNNDAIFSENIAYGDDPLQAFDIFIPESDEPTPLIIWIHGGGFTAGDKADFYTGSMASHIQETLDASIAYASLNYRLLQDVDDEGVIKPLNDTKRALQFIRYYADSLNIDKEQIALYGASAGAGASLWLGLSDEMADDGSTVDKIDDESTRVRAVGAIETQGSYDLVKWETVILGSVGVSLEIATALGIEQRLYSFYGMDENDNLYEDADIIAYRAKVDLLTLMTPDDPELWINNFRIADGIPLREDPLETIDALFHHPLHAKALMDQANFIGITNISYIPELDIEPEVDEDVIPFLIRHINY